MKEDIWVIDGDMKDKLRNIICIIKIKIKSERKSGEMLWEVCYVWVFIWILIFVMVVWLGDISFLEKKDKCLFCFKEDWK